MERNKMKEHDYFLNHSIEVTQGINKIVELNDVVIVQKDTFEEIITRLDNLIEDVKSLHADLTELQNETTSLSDFNAKFNNLVKQSEDILLFKK